MYEAFSSKLSQKNFATCNFAHFAICILPKFDEIDPRCLQVRVNVGIQTMEQRTFKNVNKDQS
jgi:hypothetical protein